MNVAEVNAILANPLTAQLAEAKQQGTDIADQLPCVIVFKGDVASGTNKKGGAWHKTRIGVADSAGADKDATLYLTVWREVKANKGEHIILKNVSVQMWGDPPKLSVSARDYDGGSVSAPEARPTVTLKGQPAPAPAGAVAPAHEYDYQKPNHPTTRKSIEHQNLFARACELAMFEVSKGAAAGTKVDSDLLGLKIGFWFDAVKGIFYGTADSPEARKQAEPQAEPEDDLLADI
jgi:hypothetical protein